MVWLIATDKPDPVTKCEVYRAEGCCHVDGFLCDVNTCDIRLKYNEDKK